MKVLLLTDADVFAGTERHILALGCALRNENIHVRIGCPFPSPLAEQSNAAGIEVIPIAKRGRVDWDAAKLLRQLAVREEVQIIHAHNGRTALAAAIALRTRPGAKLVTTQHFLSPARAKRHGPGAVLSRMVHRFVSSRTAGVIAISHAVADAIHRRNEIDPQRVTVIHNGLPDSAKAKLKPAAQVRAELGISQDARLVVCAARLEPEKDVKTLIGAMRQVPGVQCVIAGRGAQLDKLNRLIAEMGLQKQVRLLGFTEDSLSLIAAGDLFALPSLAEPFGLVLVEAMALGKPVIATRAGGPVEIVEDGQTGLLVAASDEAAMARAIGHLTGDREAADNMGRRGRARYEAMFTDARMAAATAAVYRGILAFPS